MATPFSKGGTPSNRVKKNFYDKSHQVNTTINYGRLQPFLVNEVLPGDSCKIDLAFGIRALPTAFPVQTKVRVDSHLFYVRSRTLWKDFQDWFCNHDSSLVMPYVSSDTLVQDLKTRSLYDFMGLPTTVNSFSSDILNPNIGFSAVYSGPSDSPSIAMNPYYLTSSSVGNTPWTYLAPPFDFSWTSTSSMVLGQNRSVLMKLVSNTGSSITLPKGSSFTVSLLTHIGSDDYSVLGTRVSQGTFVSTLVKKSLSGNSYLPLQSQSIQGAPGCYVTNLSFNSGTGIVKISFYTDVAITLPPRGTTSDSQSVFVLCCWPEVLSSGSTFVYNTSSSSQLPIDASYIDEGDFASYYNVQASPSSVPTSENIKSLPRINALPFRAYEAIYNSFYRDNRNNPLLDSSGQPIYNKYVLNVDGGEDTTRFHLYNRNWEQDYYTTATTSPMAGTAPLVGITSTGVATFADDDGTLHTVKLETASDGDTVTGASYSDNLPNSVARSLVNMATSGFSIADFRGVNALTRFLEINLRRGLRYKDQIKSHFNQTVTYEELDMPEFLGGFTQFFDSSQVNATSETEGNPLGSYAGQMAAVGGSRHTIRKTFDEPGYLIGIISIVPVPAYSQNLPKLYLKHDLLDYYFPEFGHLGFQPILQSEVAPFQSISAGLDPSSTFGYQRAWYDYMMDLDEVHGNFRDSLSDFVIYRKYGNVPTISTDFVTVKPNQINNVFTVDPYQNDIDPFLGQIHIKSYWKRPIPRYIQPSLEANL